MMNNKRIEMLEKRIKSLEHCLGVLWNQDEVKHFGIWPLGDYSKYIGDILDDIKELKILCKK